MKIGWLSKLVAVLSALVFFVLVVIIGVAFAPLRFSRGVNFTVDWNRLPDGLKRHKSEKELARIRAETIAKLTNPDSTQAANYLCSQWRISTTNAPSIATKLNQSLKVTMLGSKGKQDVFNVQLSLNDSPAVSNLCMAVAQWQTDVVYRELRKHIDLFGNFEENEKKQSQRYDLELAMKMLKQQQAVEFSAERQQQLEDYESQLRKADKPDSGFEYFGIMGDLIFDVPVEIGKNVGTKRRSQAYGIGVLTIAGVGAITVMALVLFFATSFRTKNTPPRLKSPRPRSPVSIHAPPRL